MKLLADLAVGAVALVTVVAGLMVVGILAGNRRSGNRNWWRSQ